MASPDDPKGAQAPPSDSSSVAPETLPPPDASGAASDVKTPDEVAHVAYSQNTDDPYAYNPDPYAYGDSAGSGVLTTTSPDPLPAVSGGGSDAPPPPPPTGGGEGDDDDGMLRMSFLEHLEELRSRLIRMLMGVGLAYAVSLTFSERLWLIVQAPAADALRKIGIPDGRLYQLAPMDAFNIVWVKLPILAAVFISSPWILYQIWGFISPGLYKKERRWAAPFVLSTAGLFLLGGAFAYFVAFRFGLAFLLGIGRGINIAPLVSITEYFDLFVNVMMGVSLIFEMPVIIFFLTLLHIVTPKFLISHSRYAILVITIIAAVVTPTPDVFNMMLFAVPMIFLFYIGIFASHLLVLNRENRKFPWGKLLLIVAIVALVLAGLVYFAISRYHYHFIRHWPFFIR